MKKLLKYVVTFIILIISFNLLLLLGSLFPSSLIEENVKESSKTLLAEGNLPYFKLNPNITNNNYTDSIMINACYSIDNTDPFFSYMSVRKNYKSGLTTKQLEDTKGELVSFASRNGAYDPVWELDNFLDEKIDTSIEYARYWHGYLPFLRVLLIFFNIIQIRNLLFGIFLGLFIILTILLKKKLGNIISIIFASSLIAYEYFFVSYSLESAPIFLVMIISCIVLLLFIDKIKNIYLPFFIIACISNFVDFLTVPLITLGMPLYIYILYKQKNENLGLKEAMKIVILSCISWGCGYAFTWISKWIIYDLLYNKNLIVSAISQVLYRTTSINDLAGIDILSILKIFSCNCLIYGMAIVWIIIVILLLFSIKYKASFTSSYLSYFKEVVPILSISFLPIFWYIVLANHTVLHPHFVYRHMLVCLTGGLICFKKIFVLYKKE